MIIQSDSSFLKPRTLQHTYNSGLTCISSFESCPNILSSLYTQVEKTPMPSVLSIVLRKTSDTFHIDLPKITASRFQSQASLTFGQKTFGVSLEPKVEGS